MTDLDATLSSSVWSGTRELDGQNGIAQSRLLLRAKSKLTPQITVVADGYFRYVHGYSGNTSTDIAVLREGYVSLRQGAATFRLGPQIINWGRMDLVSPTDNLSAQDYTLLSASDAEQKLGVPAASLRYRRDAASVEFVWQPVFKGSRIPLPAYPGLEYREHQPAATASDVGIRFERSGAMLSWSASYFSGHSRRPSPSLALGRFTQGVLDMDFPKVDIYGLDSEYAAGRWIFRGEAAYHRYAKSGSDAIASKESFFHGMAGVERRIGSAAIFMQLGLRRGFDYIDPRSVAPAMRGLATFNAVINDEFYRVLVSIGFGISYTSADLRWQAELATLLHPEIHDFLVRPRIKYALSDQVSIWSGADYFSGPSTGPMGRLERNSLIFVGVDYAVSPK